MTERKRHSSTSGRSSPRRTARGAFAQMNTRVNAFVDLFPGFHSLDQTGQIIRLAYFYAVEEGHESVNREELETLFRFAGVSTPRNLPQLLAYLSGKGARLINAKGELSLRREVRREIEQEVRRLRGLAAPPKLDGGSPFEFAGRVFSDAKIGALLQELRKCYPQECWNACGLLIRIIVERTLDTIDASVRSKTGLKDKINACRGLTTLSKSLREALDGLQGAKIMGDIAAHHSKIILDKPDVDLVLPTFRILIKEAKSV